MSEKKEKLENLLIRFKEARRIYSGSPAINITYVDFCRLYEDLEDILELTYPDKTIGFKSE